MMIDSERKYIASVILGAIGDAIGSGFEFIEVLSVEDISDLKKILGGDLDCRKNVFDYDMGHITDDTILMLCAMESFIASGGRYSEGNQLEKIKSYVYHGRHSPDLIAFDYGVATYRAVLDYDEFGFSFPEDNCGGNGALMKMAPFAYHFYKKVNPRFLREYSKKITSLTHGSSAYEPSNSMIKVMSEGFEGKKYKSHRVKNYYDEVNYTSDGYSYGSINLALREMDKMKVSSLGFLPSVKKSFENLIMKGNDTDTNCCILGQMVGSNIETVEQFDEIIEWGAATLKYFDTIMNITNRFLECINK